jgi:hypothetical protein
MASPGGPVVCFSYLAAASLWQVTQFPRPNYGAEVQAIEESIAADGAMVAAVLVGLGHPSLLLANNVGGDSRGAHVCDWLRDRGVETTARMADGPPTPQRGRWRQPAHEDVLPAPAGRGRGAGAGRSIAVGNGLIRVR